MPLASADCWVFELVRARDYSGGNRSWDKPRRRPLMLPGASRSSCQSFIKASELPAKAEASLNILCAYLFFTHVSSTCVWLYFFLFVFINRTHFILVDGSVLRRASKGQMESHSCLRLACRQRIIVLTRLESDLILLHLPFTGYPERVAYV